MIRHLMAVDTTWLVHRSYSMSASNHDHESLLRVVSYQVAAQVFRYALRLQATNIMCAFDGGNIFRYEVWPFYKANRHDLEGIRDIKQLGVDVASKLLRENMASLAARSKESLPVHDCLNATRSLLTDLDVSVAHHPKLEADDCLCSASSLVPKGAFDKVTLVCSDKDMIQGVVAPTVQLYKPQMGKTPERFVRHSDMRQYLVHWAGRHAADWDGEQFLDYQTLVGDPTDFVPRIVKPTAAVAIIQEHGSLKKYVATDTGAKFFRLHSEWIQRNRRLVTMVTNAFDGWKDVRHDTRVADAVVSALRNHRSKSLESAAADYIQSRSSFGRPSLFN